jgi:hypothetical protein
MGTFKIYLLIIVILGGCAPIIYWSSKAKITHPEKKIPPLYPYIPTAPAKYPYGDVKSFKVGEWVHYKIISDERYELKIKVVGKLKENLWIEIIKTTPEGMWISSQLIDSTGRVLSAYYLRPGKSPAKQKLEEKIALESEWPKSLLEECEDVKIRIGSRLISAKRYLVYKTYEDGREYVEERWLSKMIPQLYDGVVKIKGEDLSIELMGFGYDAKPLAKISW